MIVGVVGKKGHGKNALGDILVKHWGFRQVAFADALKLDVRDMYGLTEEQVNGAIEQKEAVDARHGKTPRQIMQEHGDLRRADDPEFWVKALHDTVKRLRGQDRVKHFVITDVRYQNEADFVKALSGQIWKIERPGFSTGVEEAHSSETSMEAIVPDFDVTNNGTLPQLREAVMGLMFEMSRQGMLSK